MSVDGHGVGLLDTDKSMFMAPGKEEWTSPRCINVEMRIGLASNFRNFSQWLDGAGLSRAGNAYNSDDVLLASPALFHRLPECRHIEAVMLINRGP